MECFEFNIEDGLLTGLNSKDDYMKKLKRKRKRLPIELVVYHRIISKYHWRQCFDRRKAVISEYIEHLDMVLEQNPNIPVIPYARVSTLGQSLNGNLEEQSKELCRELKRRGANIICSTFKEVKNGSVYTPPGLIWDACKLANKVKGVIVAISFDRIIRPFFFDPRKKQFTEPIVPEMKMLRSVTRRARLVTIEHPDIANSDAHSRHTKRGMREKNKMGGRPKKIIPGAKKKRREKYKPLALDMKKNGESCRIIGRELGIPHTTISDWCKELSDSSR
jgi:hypothetical protein